MTAEMSSWLGGDTVLARENEQRAEVNSSRLGRGEELLGAPMGDEQKKAGPTSTA